MDFDFLGAIGWRDVVLVLAVVVGVYLVLAVLRLFQIGRRKHEAKPQGARGFFGREPRESPEPEFSRELARSNVELELERLRREGVLLREEVARLAEEVARLKLTRQGQQASPLYNEATVLAQRGMPAAGIAGQCGISIGEAELVAALARGGAEFDLHGQDEDRNERNTHSGNRTHG